MPDFEWSPEAIDRIYRRLDGGTFGTTSKDCIKAVLHAAEAQPVVALPPCPTCKGKGVRPHGSDLYDWAVEGDPCPACNGSGDEPVVPVSEVVAWLEKREVGSARINDFEREFGGHHAD